LDVNNLSSFSLPSDIDDESFLATTSFVSPVKRLQYNSESIGCEGTSSEMSAANLGRLQRRNSIVEKMQRLNDIIINSPARTPPVSRLNYLITPSRNPQSLQAVESFSAFSSYTSNGDGPSGFRNTANGNNMLPLQHHVAPCNFLVQNQADDFNHFKPCIAVKPVQVQPVTSSPVQSDISSLVEECCLSMKRLSFTSSASSSKFKFFNDYYNRQKFSMKNSSRIL